MFAKNRNLLILSFSLIVVMLGFGMVIPIFPFYIDKLGAGGSALGLLVATAAYLMMSNELVAHLTFNFPELLLVQLALILLIGTYQGYRLTELRRFRPMVENR